jgi:hypothetical protein
MHIYIIIIYTYKYIYIYIYIYKFATIGKEENIVFRSLSNRISATIAMHAQNPLGASEVLTSKISGLSFASLEKNPKYIIINWVLIYFTHIN